MCPLLSSSPCSITSSHFPLAFSLWSFPRLLVLRFGMAALTHQPGRRLAAVLPLLRRVALFFEGHSHGNMGHYATLANIHSDSLPSCLCPARQLQHLSSSTWDTQGRWPGGQRSPLIISLSQVWITGTSWGKVSDESEWVLLFSLLLLLHPEATVWQQETEEELWLNLKVWKSWAANKKKKKENFPGAGKIWHLCHLKWRDWRTPHPLRANMAYGRLLTIVKVF